jgi:hypothetical protein
VRPRLGLQLPHVPRVSPLLLPLGLPPHLGRRCHRRRRRRRFGVSHHFGGSRRRRCCLLFQPERLCGRLLGLDNGQQLGLLSFVPFGRRRRLPPLLLKGTFHLGRLRVSLGLLHSGLF